jgi:catechol 2,3-dioxygenase-like lactoylglutathione lyase family enzyme
MLRAISYVIILVKDEDEALDFYCNKVGLEKRDDGFAPDGHRWVSVGVPGKAGPELVLLKAATEAQAAAVGKQTGDIVAVIINTDDCDRDYELLKSRGVEFLGPPEPMPFGKEVAFKDLYGNIIELNQDSRNL